LLAEERTGQLDCSHKSQPHVKGDQQTQGNTAHMKFMQKHRENEGRKKLGAERRRIGGTGDFCISCTQTLSLGSQPISRIQGLANNSGEYHKNPTTMVASAATNTATSSDYKDALRQPPGRPSTESARHHRSREGHVQRSASLRRNTRCSNKIVRSIDIHIRSWLVSRITQKHRGNA